MCYGIIINGEYCQYEIKSGPDAGDCTKPYYAFCPDVDEPETEEEGDDNE